jgi:hypothetical protein
VSAHGAKGHTSSPLARKRLNPLLRVALLKKHQKKPQKRHSCRMHRGLKWGLPHTI